jgi:hypothetical protein
MIKKKSTKFIIVIIILIILNSTIYPTTIAISKISGNQSKLEISEKSQLLFNLPDLNFLSIKSWWGYTNRSGIFVDYDINNSGEHYHSLLPIESNLTFFADDNKTPFGYIIQKPLLDPYTWYKGEILGGNFFFDMEEKPDYITVVIDYTDLITEYDENNNNITIKVENGIIISGNIYEKINSELVKIDEIVELNQYNNITLDDFGFRHFWSNENGEYNLSLCPMDPVEDSHVYHIKAYFPYENSIIVKKTDPVKSGDNVTIDIILEGSKPEKPKNPFNTKIGIIDRNVTLITSGFDEDEDEIFYKFSWGDGKYSDWIGPYDSNDIIITHNSWNWPGKYTINVISKDNNDILSEWSDDSSITIIDKFDYNVVNFIQKIINIILDKLY